MSPTSTLVSGSSGAKLTKVDVYSAAPASYSASSLAGISLLLISIAARTPAPAQKGPGLQTGGAVGRAAVEYVVACEGAEAEVEYAEGGDGFGARDLIEQIHQIAVSRGVRDDDEPVPSPDVCHALVKLLKRTETIMGRGLPSGDVSSFYGELSVTWRSGDRMVSIFIDNDGTAIHYGRLTREGVGGYESEVLIGKEGSAVLAEKLNGLQSGESITRTATGGGSASLI